MPEIEKLVKSLEDECKEIKKDLYKICWYMRGSLTFEQAFQLDRESRDLVYDIIKENLQTAKETGLPFF